MKKFTTYVFSAISIFSLVYFTIKYYCDSKLNFSEHNIIGWTILILIILATLVIGIINNREIGVVKNQNRELVAIVNKLLERQDDVCDEILETLQNSREISLDIYNKIKCKGD